MIESALGYRDNLLLSHADEAASGFVRGRVEFLAFNVSEGRFDCSMFGELNGRRYFSNITVGDEKIDHDANAWVYAEPGYRLNDRLKLSLPVTGYYRDEVLDVSNTEVVRNVAAWKLWGASVAPAVHWTFHPAWSIEASATGDRRRYDDHSEDCRVGAGELRLTWRPASRVETRLTGTRRWRDFDSRAQYNATGFELPGTQLKIAEREAELRVDLSWDEAAHWKTSSRASVLDYRDNGSGFFNYKEKGVTQELEWKTAKWLARLEGTARRLDFAVQTVGLGLAPPPLVKDHFAAGLQLERTLSRRWTVFGGYTWERRRSNDRIVSYTVNEGLLGLRWSWEK